MTISRLPVGELNMDMGCSPGSHLWVAKDVVMGPGGYDQSPSWLQYADVTLTNGHVVKGVGSWRGANTGRLYVATNDKFWELGGSVGAFTNVTGTSTSNAANGVTFASYGEWVFAANGVDPIQAMKVPSALADVTNFQDMTYTSGGAHISPKYICSHKNHIVTANLTFLDAYGTISEFTTPVGAGFTNQPNNGRIEVVSSDGGDTAPDSVTIYGTKATFGDTVFAETLDLNGLTAVPTTATNWNNILGINADFTPLGTITLRKFGAAGNITTFTTAAGSGIVDVTATEQAGGDNLLDLVASGVTSGVIGIIGTGINDAALWDSQGLNSTTTVRSNYEFRTFTHILTGDLPNTLTATVTGNVFGVGENEPYLVWWSGVDDPEGYGTEVYAPQIVGSSNQPLLDGVGKITGVIDGGDCFFVFKEGSIHRFDGPPFQPTTISSSVGMPAGNTAYRQNDRVYFWSIAGLRYIDIKSNEVVKAADGTAQRAITGNGVGVYVGLDSAWPKSNTTPLEYVSGACTGSVVSISGDPANSIVFVLYYNGSGVMGSHGLTYDEVTDRFTQIVGPTLSNAVGTYIIEMRTDSGSETYPLGGNLKCLYKTSDANLRADSFTRVGFTATTSVRDAYLRWPFWSALKDGSSVPSKIYRVRPVFDNLSTFVEDAVFYVKVEVLSVSGVAKSWYVHGNFKTGYATTAIDGWVTIDGAPYSDKHSIGVSITGVGDIDSPAPFLANFIGIDIDWKAGVGKSI